MGLEDVDRDEAIRLGVLAEDQEVQPMVEEFNAKLEASAAGLSPELKGALETHFGGQIAVEGERVVWQSNQGQTYERQRAEQQQIARSAYTDNAAAFERVRSSDWHTSLETEVLRGIEQEWRSQVAAVVAGRKPLYHEYLGPVASDIAADLRKTLPVGVQVRGENDQLFVWRPDVLTGSFEDVVSLLNSGRALGYGVEQFNPAVAKVPIEIVNEAGTVVSGFRAPAKGHALFGKARAQDFVDATGRPHFWRLGASKAVGP
jgi:hypothetical protein